MGVSGTDRSLASTPAPAPEPEKYVCLCSHCLQGIKYKERLFVCTECLLNYCQVCRDHHDFHNESLISIVGEDISWKLAQQRLLMSCAICLRMMAYAVACQDCPLKLCVPCSTMRGRLKGWITEHAPSGSVHRSYIETLSRPFTWKPPPRKPCTCRMVRDLVGHCGGCGTPLGIGATFYECMDCQRQHGFTWKLCSECNEHVDGEHTARHTMQVTVFRKGQFEADEAHDQMKDSLACTECSASFDPSQTPHPPLVGHKHLTYVREVGDAFLDASRGGQWDLCSKRGLLLFYPREIESGTGATCPCGEPVILQTLVSVCFDCGTVLCALCRHQKRDFHRHGLTTCQLVEAGPGEWFNCTRCAASMSITPAWPDGPLLTILLVPTTEILLTTRDADSNAPYADLASADDFLGSHVLRMPGTPLPGAAKDAGTVRDNRGKAKQFTTMNGRTVVVKDNMVYSNKGFKHLNQVHLLTDALWYPDGLDAQHWLIYYISRPLVGSMDVIKIIPAVLSHHPPSPSSPSTAASSPIGAEPKKDIKTFNDLLNAFPMIARQMQTGLERVFHDFAAAMEKAGVINGVPSADTDGSTAVESSAASTGSDRSNGHAKAPAALVPVEDEKEMAMRAALETAVTAAIDLFQLVDKQQLSLLGATTDLTGPLVERLIERYVTEQLHDALVFPTLCALRRADDQELEHRIRQREDVDVSQVGIAVQGGLRGKHELIQRLQKAVEAFRRLSAAGSPQEMVEILLETERIVTMVSPDRPGGPADASVTEKPPSVMTINADTLVSLLLVVVIRAQVRHLHARLSYMRHFIFLDDVEGGEMGYALSTFEAVLSYLAKDSGGLRKASRRNRALWQATRDGQLVDMKAILEPGLCITPEATLVDEPAPLASRPPSPPSSPPPDPPPKSGDEVDEARLSSALKRVLPMHPHEPTQANGEDVGPTVRRKTVSMDTQSVSSSSTFSLRSRTTTLNSRWSDGGLEGDTSIDKLSKTQDATGESVPMMAIQSRQPAALRYLLGLTDYFPVSTLMDDVDNEGTTLLSAAIQLGQDDLIAPVLDTIGRAADPDAVAHYLAQQDVRGRSAAHYLFNAPQLIARLGRFLPWRLKDRNGQTPLFALCRSYDHPHYRDMIDHALSAAQVTQPDGLPLHLDDHVDGKGNSLLHIVHDPPLARRIMDDCDTDVNATNDKRFTALMVASKYGRLDTVRTLFSDPRVDLAVREARGLTAVELAKDDEVRNRIDDLVLLSDPGSVDGRTTAVVRSFFVEDASVRLVLKSAAPASASTITITTSRRSLADFENLAKWLAIEHPASWLPPVPTFRSAFQIASKPSRAVLRDIQQRMDRFLKVLLSHSTFGTHELVWEFFLAPEIQPEMMAERSRKKADMRAEMVKEEYAPMQELREVEIFVGHARDAIRGVHHATASVVRRTNTLRIIHTDLADAASLTARAFSTVAFLPPSHIRALARYAIALAPTESAPYALFYQDVQCIATTITAMLAALARPGTLISSMSSASKAIDRHMSSVRRSDRWPLGLMDETRNKLHQEAADRVRASQRDLLLLGSELRYTQQTVAAELAGWQDLHAKMARRALRTLAQRTVVAERARLESLRRAVRGVLPGRV
ncbi:MAG: hypothetical protein M1838_000347 [Thelocarpon superellum]|nr:MAG: hypothetical protein M1838_000347 [Thelocarpon superellum]